MAILEREDEGWIVWAIELMRRGLKPIDDITVHGPHDCADFMWGEAECDWYGSNSGFTYDVKFRTAYTHSIWDVRGVRVQSKDDRESFPILKEKDMPSDWRKELESLKAELRKLKKDQADIFEEVKRLRG